MPSISPYLLDRARRVQAFACSVAVPLLSRLYVVVMLVQGLGHRIVMAARGTPGQAAPPVPAGAHMPAMAPPAMLTPWEVVLATVMPLQVDADGAAKALILRDAASGALFFGLRVDGDDTADRWLYAPITPAMHAQIVGALADTRDVLTRGHVVVVDRAARGGAVVRAWLVAGANLPDDYVPVPGVRFTAEDIVVALHEAEQAGSPRVVS